jgi:hypothetical protein
MPEVTRGPVKKNRKSRGNVIRNTAPGIALVLASMLPLALTSSPAGKPARKSTPKEFSIPISNLQDWSNRVVITMAGVQIKGNSDVHQPAKDCEIHFGAQSDGFQGQPEGLVLEPMNACVAPFPGKTEHNNSDWTAFADRIRNTTVTVSGVPRIWPEHLKGGNETSNPNHAVEIHPLTEVVTPAEKVDFAPTVFFSGDFTGIGTPTAESIVQNTSVTVTRVDDEAAISFSAGTIGNFHVFDVVIDRASITNDGAGSFRMNGEVVLDDSTTLPVRMVTAKGSPINNEIAKIKKQPDKKVNIEGLLVLFSLSPKALLDAANKSQGDPVEVETPIQLIVYGTANSE